jgi:hypothetical protein
LEHKGRTELFGGGQTPSFMKKFLESRSQLVADPLEVEPEILPPAASDRRRPQNERCIARGSTWARLFELPEIEHRHLKQKALLLSKQGPVTL